MLKVNGIKNGVVIDHIPAGKGLKVFNLLFSDIKEPMVLLMNVKSNALGIKDIIKIENTTTVNLEMLGLISQNISVNYIENDALINKIHVKVPSTISGGIKCSNPRCITHSDDYAIPTFKLLSSNGKAEYECNYCEEITIYRL